MHREIATESDSSLLQAWCDERSQRAFAELVRRYERLVAGAALRRAGDFELARDVTQQVFTTLAAKARLLVGRPNIAGWLYHAASLLAAQLRRSDVRRLTRDTTATAVAENRAEAPGNHWSILEDALGQLSTADREALLLHYFQDLSYPEMAAQLGIGEPAARKRVSRGLQKLGPVLRKHGLGAPQGLLAGAAALQIAPPAHAVLAAGAMAGTSTVSTPFILIFHALMSHLPVKIAIGAATLALFPLGYEWTANANLHAQLTEQQRSPGLPATAADGNFPPGPPAANANAQAEAKAELDRLLLAARTAEGRVAELSLFKDRAKDELVVSLGSVESMAKRFGTALRQMREFNDANDHAGPGGPDPKAQEATVQKMQAGLPGLFEVIRELPRLERNPAKAARFYSTMLAETGELDEATRARIEPVLEAWVTRLQKDTHALSQRPHEPAEAVVQWDRRRVAAMESIRQELQALVPAEKSERMDLFKAMLMEGNVPAASGSFDIMTGRNRKR